MSGFSQLWKKLAKNKKYREEFVAAQVKRGIPFQIRTLLKQHKLSQEELASRAGLTQGAVSRAANPDYGNLTLNTIVRIAAGFDISFVGRFVPFSELGKWFTDLSEESVRVKTFDEENESDEILALVGAGAEREAQPELQQAPPDENIYTQFWRRPVRSETVHSGAAQNAMAGLR